MPIYMDFDGIKGTVKASSHAGGANFAMADGSVRFFKDSISAVEVSSIALRNSQFDAIDALASNAVVKARALFEAQRSMVIAHGLVFTIPQSGANKLRHANNLRQMPLAALGKISTIKFLITDNSNPRGVIIKFENVLMTELLFNRKFIGEGVKVNIAFCKTDKG